MSTGKSNQSIRKGAFSPIPKLQNSTGKGGVGSVGKLPNPNLTSK